MNITELLDLLAICEAEMDRIPAGCFPKWELIEEVNEIHLLLLEEGYETIFDCTYREPRQLLGDVDEITYYYCTDWFEYPDPADSYRGY